MNIINYKYMSLGFSGILVFASIVALVVWGLRPGIDFTGGSILEVEFVKQPPSADRLRSALAELGLDQVVVQSSEERGVIFRFKHIDESLHQKILSRLGQLETVAPPAVTPPKNFEDREMPTLSSKLTEKRFDTIGPTVGKELRRSSIIALALALGAIVLYIAFAFRHVSEPVSSWKYGVVAIAALIHDVVIPSGLLAALGHFKGVEVDALFVTALLTIMGFSVHDTIVVFDRIRERLRITKGRESYSTTVNQSVNETLARSINTSLAVLLVLLAIVFFGGTTVYYFAFTLVVGILFGTYSSIFVASPLLVIWHGWRGKHNIDR